MLRVVDISSHQGVKGIDPAALDCDAIIVKATGGFGYTNPYFREHVDKVLGSGKLLGIYHYARENSSPGTARAESEHFLDVVEPYKGRFVPILDWEANALLMPPSWAREWLSTVQRELNATPMFYAYAHNLNSTDYTALLDWPLWMASYLYRYVGAGWVDDPVNTWRTGVWPRMTMYQYTSTGRIDGFWDDLDLSVFYGSKQDWIDMEDDMSDAYDFLSAKTDATGRKKYADMRTRLAYMAEKQEKMQDSIDGLSKKLDAIAKKLDK